MMQIFVVVMLESLFKWTMGTMFCTLAQSADFSFNFNGHHKTAFSCALLKKSHRKVKLVFLSLNVLLFFVRHLIYWISTKEHVRITTTRWRRELHIFFYKTAHGQFNRDSDPELLADILLFSYRVHVQFLITSAPSAGEPQNCFWRVLATM